LCYEGQWASVAKAQYSNGWLPLTNELFDLLNDVDYNSYKLPHK